MITVGQYLIKQLEDHEHKVFHPTGYYDKEALITAAKTLDHLIMYKTVMGGMLTPIESLGVNLLLDCLDHDNLMSLSEAMLDHMARTET